jgi:hypothetical protein
MKLVAWDNEVIAHWEYCADPVDLSMDTFDAL